MKNLSDTIPKLRRCSISTSKELGLDGFDWNTFLHWLQKLDQKYIALLAEFWPCRLRDTALVVQVIYCLCVHLLYFLFLRIAGFFISLFVYGYNAFNLVMAWETLHWWTKRSYLAFVLRPLLGEKRGFFEDRKLPKKLWKLGLVKSFCVSTLSPRPKPQQIYSSRAMPLPLFV